MARPSTAVVGHDQAPCRGSRPRPSHLQGGSRLRPRPPWAAGCYQCQPAGGAAAREHNHLQCGACKGGRLQGTRKERLSVAIPQGAAKVAASRGSGAGGKSDYRRARAAAAYIGVTTPA
ncbi:hypothetical protein B296_00016357 [Ensete ventricosum]|uniref:Uncharacterized protein n=1 Tax=Ensete ventricosum TaxID=4639 RepID=A0A426Z8F1_ENSVE|nr:hypothetical protein B296_00016357 [Ensete ventricosum]